MSRGPGRIEQAIAAILDAEPDNAFTTEDLCDRVYPGVNRVEKKHRVAVLRAANSLARRRDNTGCEVAENLGRTRVYFNIDNVMSYAMARLKADQFNRYRSNDDRWITPEHHPKWYRKAMGYEKGYVYQHPRMTEADLRARLADGREHKYVVPGGAWWKHTQRAIAELQARRNGDTNRLEEIAAERKADFEKWEREFSAGA